MSTAGVIVLFIITWWLVLFTTLPFGVQRDENPEPGNEPGAPVKARMITKALVTTAIATTITATVYFSAEAGWLPLREWLSPQSN
ncbi:MAG: DUF1467 family protein [Alphaproteobacteria bacterium]|nr:DUF1467 family protein [Alphaproteobacteria bacterium]